MANYRICNKKKIRKLNLPKNFDLDTVQLGIAVVEDEAAKVGFPIQKSFSSHSETLHPSTRRPARCPIRCPATLPPHGITHASLPRLDASPRATPRLAMPRLDASTRRMPRRRGMPRA